MKRMMKDLDLMRRCDEEDDEDLDLMRRCDEEDDEDLDLMRRCDEEDDEDLDLMRRWEKLALSFICSFLTVRPPTQTLAAL
ncbi:hypothetical protein KUCAC02_019127 [Chaenocephalus aceratus]|uniref:Uncharacterized protein n=1 Tax=Chaenocephalus aceratus TaxID=36190 RepID=A0ACB9WBH6_CHAAC|nr:hypothetical protein KUCAC02_019127 [Chaenocephalus aceratus]